MMGTLAVVVLVAVVVAAAVAAAVSVAITFTGADTLCESVTEAAVKSQGAIMLWQPCVEMAVLCAGAHFEAAEQCFSR